MGLLLYRKAPARREEVRQVRQLVSFRLGGETSGRYPDGPGDHQGDGDNADSNSSRAILGMLNCAAGSSR